MHGYKREAKEYQEAGLNPVPLPMGGKVPAIKEWSNPISNVDDYDFEEIGICTGAVSGGLEAIDLDLDVLPNPDEFWEHWKSKIPVSILQKLVVCQTYSGGYHVLYRTTISEGNKKLACLEDKRVFIETRGQGGYVKCFPSSGYKVIYGDLTKINMLEDFERNTLISTSILFDKRIAKKKHFYGEGEYEDPFPEYNSDPDIGLDILEEEGWEVLKTEGEWVHLRRPDKRREGTSATYNLESNFLYVFSTQTDFETEQPYSNSAIFCILKCGGNFRLGYTKLNRMGYGKDKTSKADEEELEDLSFISKRGEDEEKLDQAIDGTIPLGLSLGWPDLDEYYVFKQNSTNFVLGFEGVGKSMMMLHGLMGLAVTYNKKFAICCGEDEVSKVKRIILEGLTGRKITDFKGRSKDLEPFKDFMNAHFFIFKNEVLYSVEDVLERTVKLHEIYKIDGVFIDPFSYFKKPGGGTYSYNDELLSELKVFSKAVCSVIMTVHPNTEATRKGAPRDKDGYLMPPSHYDAIGGNMFANRTDHFLVFHRITNHKVQQLRRIMEIRSCKVRDYDTGGSITPIDESVSLTYKLFDGFLGYFDSNNVNPMHRALKKSGKDKRDDEPQLPRMSPADGIF